MSIKDMIKKMSVNGLYTSIRDIFRRKYTVIFTVALVCLALIIAFNFLFSKSFGVDCKDYCEDQPHVACLGFWNITGQYPNCNCQYICWSSKSCSSDLDCEDNEKCYSSFEAGEQVGDLFCHQLCDVNADCPEITPYCRRVNITIGKASDLVKMCMMEECVKNSDCPQPRCIGMHAICDDGECRTVNAYGLPARCN